MAFVGHHRYAPAYGAGCSHGVRNVPNGVIRVHHGGRWSLIANLSAFQRSHPVAKPDVADFEPDGTWYSMTSFQGALYPMDSNHGELDRITPSGRISRVIDISAEWATSCPQRSCLSESIVGRRLLQSEPSASSPFGRDDAQRACVQREPPPRDRARVEARAGRRPRPSPRPVLRA